jgi:hypothetical protein
MMTVKKLKKLLAGLDDNTPVLMSRDSEGNSYSPLSGYDEGFVDSVKEYCIESYYSKGYNWEDNGFDSKEEWEEYQKKHDKVIVLFPTN